MSILCACACIRGSGVVLRGNQNFLYLDIVGHSRETSNVVDDVTHPRELRMLIFDSERDGSFTSM